MWALPSVGGPKLSRVRIASARTSAGPAIGATAVGVDWTVNLGQARSRIGHQCAIQGNMDPMALMAGPAEVRAEAIRTLESFGPPTDGSAHIFNLGHGINQFTPPDNVQALVESVHRYSQRTPVAG